MNFKRTLGSFPDITIGLILFGLAVSVCLFCLSQFISGGRFYQNKFALAVMWACGKSSRTSRPIWSFEPRNLVEDKFDAHPSKWVHRRVAEKLAEMIIQLDKTTSADQ